MVQRQRELWQTAQSPLISLDTYLSKHWRTFLIVFFFSFILLATLILVILKWALYILWGIQMSWADWTGFGEYTGLIARDNRGKTLWDWFELLIIPIVLALGAFWLQQSEKDNDRMLANKRREDDLAKAKDQQQEIALQTYIDKMTEILLDDKHPLRTSDPTDEVRVVARTRTLATLRRLDPDRIGILLKFLSEAELISSRRRIDEYTQKEVSDDPPIISLSGADLVSANLERANLARVNLERANLAGANLKKASMEGAFLVKARLTGANLEGASLTKADLAGAGLAGACLILADLAGANLERAFLKGACLTMANLRGANLKGAKLGEVTLTDAIMPDGKVYDPAVYMIDEFGSLVEKVGERK